jgi:histone deacetylase 11
MNVYCRDEYNINLGILNRLHPFDGLKFRKIFRALSRAENIEIVEPDTLLSTHDVDDFLSPLIQRFVRNKAIVLQALEVPAIPLPTVSFY